MATLIVKTNVSHTSDFLITDVGIFIPALGGNEVFDTELDKNRIVQLQGSTSLHDAILDNTYGINSSTLILNDGISDISQSEAIDFLANIFVTSTKEFVLAIDGSFIYIDDGDVLTLI